MTNNITCKKCIKNSASLDNWIHLQSFFGLYILPFEMFVKIEVTLDLALLKGPKKPRQHCVNIKNMGILNE